MKKKGKRKRTPEALAPETASAVEGLLQDIKSHEDRGDSLEISLQAIRTHLGGLYEKDMAIVAAMGGVPTERMARLLQALLGSVSDKGILKGIRRSLYRIEQRGVPIERVGEETPEPSVLRPPVEDQAKGFISGVDSEGVRIVFLRIPRKPKGLHLFQGIVSDTRGLIEFNGMETTKRGFREFYQSISAPGRVPVVEVDAGYCRFLLEEAAQLTEERGEVPPAPYLASKGDLARVERMETPPAFLFLDEDAIQRDPRLLRNSSDLFQIEPFSSWFLPPEDVRKYAELIEEAEESRLVLNPVQKETRLQETYQKAMIELFPDNNRLRYKRRLEEMAYILLKEGKEDRARAALAASIDLRFAPRDLEPNPFLLNLVMRSIYAIVARDAEKKKAEPSLIVKP